MLADTSPERRLTLVGTGCGGESQEQKGWSLETQGGGKGNRKWPPGQSTVKQMLETMGTKSHAVVETGSLNLVSVNILGILCLTDTSFQTLPQHPTDFLPTFSKSIGVRFRVLRVDLGFSLLQADLLN